LLWSGTTKRLLGSNGLGEKYLAMVALYLCLKEACLLVEGKRVQARFVVPRDELALADCPFDLAELQGMRDRAEKFRDEVLHLSDKTQDGRALHTSWTIEKPQWTFKSSVGSGRKLEWDSISQEEIEQILKTLNPWLRGHWERLTQEETGIDASILPVELDA
jgi:hypothetical protein